MGISCARKVLRPTVGIVILLCLLYLLEVQVGASRFEGKDSTPSETNRQVPLWTVEDVTRWLRENGFEKYSPAFADIGMDGDLLLQLDDEILKHDLGIMNGIVRRRFLRELSKLRQTADYSSLDHSNLCSLLATIGARSTFKTDFVQYLYPMLQAGMTRDNLHKISNEQLFHECRILNAFHRSSLISAIREWKKHAKNEVHGGTDVAPHERKYERPVRFDKTLDVFISYRRSTGSVLASLIKVHLQRLGYSVFLDVYDLERGQFDESLIAKIKSAKNFVLLLSPKALDRCKDDKEVKDMLHREIIAAGESGCNIVPVFDNYEFPNPNELPEDIRWILGFNGVIWIHEYQEAGLKKLDRLISSEMGDANVTSIGPPVSP